MENKAHAMAAGIFVALLSALVLGLAAWLTRDTGARDPYEISTRIAVSGLAEQAPVRFRGIDVGKVKTIGFDPRVTGNVLVRIEVDHDTPLTRDTFATLSYQGVTGLAYIQLEDEGRQAPRLVPNDEAPPRIPLRPGLLQRLEERGEVILDRVQKVAERVDTLLGDENQQRFSSALDNIAKAAAGTEQLTRRIDNTIARQLDPALAQAKSAFGSVERAADQIGTAAARVDSVATEFGRSAELLNAKGGPFDRVSEGTDALANAAESFTATTLPRINRATEQTTRAVRTLSRAINELTENPQMLIYGEGAVLPGPGEPGFQAPEGRR